MGPARVARRQFSPTTTGDWILGQDYDDAPTFSWDYEGCTAQLTFEPFSPRQGFGGRHPLNSGGW